jgi:hypothetical protein
MATFAGGQGVGVAGVRKDAYASAVGGHRFTLRAAAYTAGPASFTAQTSFVATTPTVLIQNSATKRNLVLSGFWFSMLGTVAGGDVYLSIFRDTAARYSSGGTAFKTYPTDGVSHAYGAGIPAFTAYYNPTATAAVNPATTAGAGTHPLYDFVFPASVTSGPFHVDIEDGIRIGQTGSILIYMYGATVGPTVVVGAEVIEEAMER